MTDETEITDELVEAIWREAWLQTWPKAPVPENVPSTTTAIRLALSGWRPTDPDLILARECAAEGWTALKATGFAEDARNGRRDTDIDVQSALRAIKALRKQMEGGQ